MGGSRRHVAQREVLLKSLKMLGSLPHFHGVCRIERSRLTPQTESHPVFIQKCHVLSAYSRYGLHKIPPTYLFGCAVLEPGFKAQL